MVAIGMTIVVLAWVGVWLGWYADKSLKILSDGAVSMWKASCVCLLVAGGIVAILGALGIGA